MSISTFKREFAKEFNASPIQWINDKRLEKSLLLIKNTTMPISDIAYECGFENYIHFARRFRAKYGKPANSFRTEKLYVKLTGLADISIFQNKLYIPNLPASKIVVIPL